MPIGYGSYSSQVSGIFSAFTQLWHRQILVAGCYNNKYIGLRGSQCLPCWLWMTIQNY